MADATASIDYGGVLRIAVRQRRPVVRLLFDGYNAYATDEGYLFAAPQSSALYVPVMTGSYAPPAPASYTGSIADYTAARIANRRAASPRSNAKNILSTAPSARTTKTSRRCGA